VANVLISGASGLVGSALVEKLRGRGDQIYTLVRREPRNDHEIRWLEKPELPQEIAFDAVVHLAGEPVAGIWTAAKKRAIYASRVPRTHALADALAAAKHKPEVLVCASAIGYYGSRGDETLTESSPPGNGFLPSTCIAWEQAADPARAAGIRTVHLRIGIVMSGKGGALRQMLPPFKLGLGSRLGSGKQWFSWIALDDLVRVIELAVDDPSVSGVINATSPSPVTNAEFTRTLAQTLHRPTFVPIPAFMLKAAPGGMGEEALLASAKVIPKKLLDASFRFAHPDLAETLATELKK
jgi:uncharacterized protein